MENGELIQDAAVELVSSSDDDSNNSASVRDRNEDRGKTRSHMTSRKNLVAKKSNRSVNLNEIIQCTACHNQINVYKSGAACQHPVLKVLICRRCYEWYTSADIEQGDDGTDEQCRWCGEGGRLVMCGANCHNVFCKTCIRQNLGRPELTQACENNDWQCYVCNPQPLTELRQYCTDVLSAIDKLKISSTGFSAGSSSTVTSQQGRRQRHRRSASDDELDDEDVEQVNVNDPVIFLDELLTELDSIRATLTGTRDKLKEEEKDVKDGSTVVDVPQIKDALRSYVRHRKSVKRIVRKHTNRNDTRKSDRSVNKAASNGSVKSCNKKSRLASSATNDNGDNSEEESSERRVRQRAGKKEKTGQMNGVKVGQNTDSETDAMNNDQLSDTDNDKNSNTPSVTEKITKNKDQESSERTFPDENSTADSNDSTSKEISVGKIERQTRKFTKDSEKKATPSSEGTTSNDDDVSMKSDHGGEKDSPKPVPAQDYKLKEPIVVLRRGECAGNGRGGKGQGRLSTKKPRGSDDAMGEDGDSEAGGSGSGILGGADGLKFTRADMAAQRSLHRQLMENSDDDDDDDEDKKKDDDKEDDDDSDDSSDTADDDDDESDDKGSPDEDYNPKSDYKDMKRDAKKERRDTVKKSQSRTARKQLNKVKEIMEKKREKRRREEERLKKKERNKSKNSDSDSSADERKKKKKRLESSTDETKKKKKSEDAEVTEDEKNEKKKKSKDVNNSDADKKIKKKKHTGKNSQSDDSEEDSKKKKLKPFSDVSDVDEDKEKVKKQASSKSDGDKKRSGKKDENSGQDDDGDDDTAGKKKEKKSKRKSDDKESDDDDNKSKDSKSRKQKLSKDVEADESGEEVKRDKNTHSKSKAKGSDKTSKNTANNLEASDDNDDLPGGEDRKESKEGKRFSHKEGKNLKKSGKSDEDSDEELDREIKNLEKMPGAKKRSSARRGDGGESGEEEREPSAEGRGGSEAGSEENMEAESTKVGSTSDGDTAKEEGANLKVKKPIKKGMKSSRGDLIDALSSGQEDDVNDDDDKENVAADTLMEMSEGDMKSIIEKMMSEEHQTLLSSVDGHHDDKEDDDAEDDDDDDDDEDDDDVIDADNVENNEATTSKAKGKKSDKGKKVITLSDDDDDDDSTTGKNRRQRNELLDAALSSSDEDSDVQKKKKSKTANKKKKKHDSDDDFEVLDDDDSEIENKKKKRRKRKRASSDEGSENDKEDGDDDDNEEDDDDDDDKGKKKSRRRIKAGSDSSAEDDEEGNSSDDFQSPSKKRKKIRRILNHKKLSKETIDAAKEEEERRKRIEEKQKLFNQVTVVDGDSPNKCPTTMKLVLDKAEVKGEEQTLEVYKKIICKLKPHQVDAVKFMWSCCYESLERIEEDSGSGCILAHCMGLGKTLSVIAFIHTILSHRKLTKQKTCLVLGPLNTILNWESEFENWLKGCPSIDVYELSSIKDNYSRAELLKNWHEDGGVMIMGYEMFRNLSQLTRIKNKKQKKIITESLLDPGPDVIVCDEGHILKNDSTGLSKACNQIKSLRRVVLTGTPLQNNLGEYHCMVNFVKPNLLGTRKEFMNRFVNPISNGQCSDSTMRDVKIMKKRAHILHESLAGCVQRRDYSSLTKFLLPKFEFVIWVRLSKVQIALYERYLQRLAEGADRLSGGPTRGSRMFTDYQNLMKIWTHPWVLRLDEIRQETKRLNNNYDSEDDSFIDDSDGDSHSSKSDTPPGGSDADEAAAEAVVVADSDDDWKPRGKRLTRGAAAAQQKTTKTRNKDDEEGVSGDQKKGGRGPKEEDTGDEIVTGWKTRSRGGNLEDYERDKMLEEEALPANSKVSNEWWAEFLNSDDQYKLEISGKLLVLSEVIRMCESIGDKVLLFSQSLLSLDIIEDFLAHWDKQECEDMEKRVGGTMSWEKGIDYLRMDGSSNAQNRKDAACVFNDPENIRARLFLISTRAGSLGINLVAANRVIIFDASWNPSHDIQSIFRVYRFGQTKPVYVYRLLAQGTMEEKIYERQVTKLSLSQRVVDEHQIERHFTAADLRELYTFRPDRLDDPQREERPTPVLPKDRLLAELITTHKDWIYHYLEHDSLLENKHDEELSEEDRKAAWEEYEDEKKGLRPPPSLAAGTQSAMMSAMNLQQMMASVGQPAQSAQMIPQRAHELALAIYRHNPAISQQELSARVAQCMAIEHQASIKRQQELQMARLRQMEQQRLQREQLMSLYQNQLIGSAGSSSSTSLSRLQQQALMPGYSGGYAGTGYSRSASSTSLVSNEAGGSAEGGRETSGEGATIDLTEGSTSNKQNIRRSSRK